MKLEAYRLRYLISALFVLALAVYLFSTYSVTTPEQSTFNLQPGYTYELSVTTRNSPDTVSGHFQETSGNPVSFYIQTSAQYAAFQSGASFDCVYGVVNSSSSAISYTFPAQDTYYLTFRHGAGLVNSTETVYFQRTNTTHNSYALTLGLIFLALVGVDLAFAFRPRKTRLAENPPQSPTTA